MKNLSIIQKISRGLLGIAGGLFIFDVYLILTNKPNVIDPNLPLPCPYAFLVLGIGLVLFAISGNSKK